MDATLRGTDQDLFCGLDIGGTKLGWCVGRGDGTLLACGHLPHADARDPQDELGEALACLDSARQRLEDRRTPLALGVACPGPITLDGRFLDPPNMPSWHGFDLAAWLRAAQPLPVAAINDANAGVAAEVLWGGARGARHAAFCTMSTGMGAGLWLNGVLYPGARGFAGEIGHLRLADDGPVGFGKRGSVEGFLSGPGLVQLAEAEVRVALQTGAVTTLATRRPLLAEDVCVAATGGDAAARRAVERCADKLGALCALLVDLLDLEVIVLGTIATAHPGLFLPRARQVLAREALRHSLVGFELTTSPLQDRGHRQALAAARCG